MALFRFGEFEADEERFELRHRSIKLPVQRLALDVLFHLIRQRSRVVSKEELVLGPWAGAKVSPGSVSRAVMLVRRATRAAGNVVETVRGRGYRFAATLREDTNSAGPQRTPAGAEPMLFVLQEVTDRAAASLMLRDLLRDGSSSIPVLLIARPTQARGEARLPLQEDG
jgi:DNA-binding winged helix-turn-helix (wHTH) protein